MSAIRLLSSACANKAVRTSVDVNPGAQTEPGPRFDVKVSSAPRALPDGVQMFFGLDPHVESAALAIIDAAGYGDTVEQQENPSSQS